MGVPPLWLLSDAVRLPDPSAALIALPPGSAVLLRDATPEIARRVARLCRQHRLHLLVSGDGRLALSLHAGLHIPDRRPTRFLLPFLASRPRGGRSAANRAGASRSSANRLGSSRFALLSVAVHGRAGIARARRLRADAALVSPAFATPSHPGASGLGPLRWSALARALDCPAIALGGMNPTRARRLPRSSLAGWASITALCFPRHSV